MNRLGEADDPSKKVGRDPVFRIGDQVADDHEDQADDTSVASEQLLDDPDEESRGDGESVDKPKTPQRKDPGMTLTKRTHQLREQVSSSQAKFGVRDGHTTPTYSWMVKYSETKFET
jgi:hypothetical protein